jgi:glutaredoxin
VSELADITVYGTSTCADCVRAKRLLDRHGIAYDYVDVEADPESLATMLRLQDGGQIVPTIVFPDGDILLEPTDPELAAKLGLEVRAEIDVT